MISLMTNFIDKLWFDWFTRIEEGGRQRSSSFQSEEEPESEDESLEDKSLLYFIKLIISD